MTIDVDGWSSLLNYYSVKHDPLKAKTDVNVEKGLAILLRLFEENGIKATFFITGEMARAYSSILREVHRHGHEIACHGLLHSKNECLLDQNIQRQRIADATAIIKREINVVPKGFRAPCLRISNITLDILEENGYLYDSSVISTFVPTYYGFLRYMLDPYHPSQHSIPTKGSRALLEIPVSVNPLFLVPLSAAWMRNLGVLWVKLGIQMNFILHHPVVFYVHPRDVLTLPKVKGVPWHLYRNVGKPALEMLTEILRFTDHMHAKFVKAIDLASIYTQA